MKKLLLLFVALGMSLSATCSHILGGELFYEHISGDTYTVTLILYRDCSGVPLGNSVSVNACAANGSGASVSGTLNLVSSLNLPTDYFLNPCLEPPGGGACIEENIYQGTMNFPSGTEGWLIYYETCCRSGNVDNLISPSSKYAIYYVFLPDPSFAAVGTPNNSARFVTSPPPNICINDSIYYDHSAYDPDGDQVTYQFWEPKGSSPAHNGCPPLPNTGYQAPYNKNYPIPSANPAFSVDPNTGAMIGKANQVGWFVYSLRYEERRNGVPISYGVRDFVFKVVDNCVPIVPIADFEPQNVKQDSTVGYCGDMTVNFTNTSNNDAIMWIWDFGDTARTDDISYAENPTWQYDRPGKYEITLITAPGYPCADTTFYEYEVYPSVKASFTPPDTQCLANNYYTFTPDTFNIEDSVIWDFGPDANPRYAYEFTVDSVQFTTSGNQTVCLIMMNQTCADTVCKEVFVAPTITAFDTPKEPACILNQSFDFKALGSFTSSADIVWDFGPRASVQTSTIDSVKGVTYDTLGYHPYTLTVSELGCSYTFMDSILITDTVQASFTPPGPQCLNSNNYDFVNTGTYDTTATFAWSFENALPDSAFVENPTNIKFQSKGKHAVTLTIYQNGCTATYTDSVEVTDAPIGFIDSIPNTCLSNATFNFSAGGSFNPSAVIEWDFGFNASPPVANTKDVNNVSFNSTGTHTVKLTITDNGCTDVQTRQFVVTAPPTATFPPVANQCLSNGPFDFVNNGNYGPDATFLWDLDQNVSPDTVYTEDAMGVQWTQAGTYTVCLTIEENGCSDTHCETFTLTPAPLGSFDSLPTSCITVNSYNMNNTGTYGGTATFDWIFENANPASSTDEHPSNVVFNQTGYNTITLNITENSCTDTYVDSVFISPVPQPTFQVPAQQCLAVNSFDFSAGGTYLDSATFFWDFGPNANIATSTDTAPTGISFNQAGYHTISLSISEYGCTGVYIDSVYVSPTPAPSFTPGPVQCLNSNSFDFTAQGTYGPNASFLWSFGPNANPDSAFVKNPSNIVFSTAGKHPVRFTVIEDGCNISFTDTIEIAPAPVASPTIPAAQCETGNSFDYAGGGTYGAGASFTWDFGPSASIPNSTALNVNGVSYPSPGAYPGYFVVEEFGCTDTFHFETRVTEQPTAYFPPLPPQCVSGSSFDFTFGGTGDTTISYDWQFGNATPPFSSNRNVNNVTFYTTGWQVVTLTVTGLGCSHTYVDSVETTANPVAIVDSFPEQCVGNNSYNWTHSSVNGSNATFSWDFGPDATPSTSTAEFPTGISFGTADTHTVTLTVEENGCTSTATTQVVITPEPISSFTNLDPQCIDGNSFNFTFDGLEGNNTSFTWNFGPNASPSTSNDKNPTNVAFSDTGTFNVSLTVTDNNCSDTYTGQVRIIDLPKVNFGYQQAGCVPFTANFTNLSEAYGPMTYFWEFGDGGTSTAANPSYVYTTPGLYSVRLSVTTSEGCVGIYDTLIGDIISAETNPISGFELSAGEVHIYDPEIEITSTALNADTAYYVISNGDVVPGFNPSYSFPDTGWYTITQVSLTSAGCLDTTQKHIKVNPMYMFFSPNAFSPDKDGKNDEFKQKGVGIREYELQIFNRWGELIYSTTDINEGWDGHTFTGEKAVQGNYAYRTRIINYFGEEFDYKGSIVLLR